MTLLGDVIRFTELMEHLPFNAAAERLAQHFGVSLEDKPVSRAAVERLVGERTQ